jgi:hypothetical protein
MMILTIPEVPPSPNELRRKYKTPWAYKKLRDMFEYALLASVGPHHRHALKEQAKKSGKLWVQMTLHHVGTYDDDNLAGSQKPVLDALVNIGFLAGDSPDKLQLLPAAQIKCLRKEQKLVVKIGIVD